MTSDNSPDNPFGQAASLLGLEKDAFLTQAERLTGEAFGNTVELCAIINIRSGACDMDCHFCGQRANASQQRKTCAIAPDKLLAMLAGLAQKPLAHIGLVASGGALPAAEFDRLISILDELPASIKKKLCLSLGRLAGSQLRRAAACGIVRYHHNLETSREFYPNVCSTQTWQSRQATVKRAQDAGLQICSGAIFGIGESWRHRLSLAQSLKDMGVNNIPLNFLDPRPGTPLSANKPPSAEESLACISLFRHILPRATLRICGGRKTSFAGRQGEIFAAGANALMTGDFLTTKGSALQDDLELLNEAGRVLAHA